jgi:hypothetical protein
MPNPFDALCRIFEANEASFLHPGNGFNLDAVEGDEGARTAQWHVEEMDEQWIMPFYLLNLFKDNNLPGNLLFHNVDKADREQEHEMIIGNISTPEESWAIHVISSVYEDERGTKNYPTGSMNILESASEIKQLVQERGVRMMSDAAFEIIKLVRDATGGDRSKLDSLRDALTEAGGDVVFDIWKTQAQAQQLDDATKPTLSSKSKRPGRL